MNQQNTNILGQQLISDFQTVFMSKMTASAAKQAAKQSEDVVMQELTSASAGSYLNPANISEAEGDYVVRASIDAHIKKVQAEQLSNLTAQQVQSIIIKDTTDFVGRKVRILAISKDYRPFDGYWFDNKNGSRSNELRKPSVEGKITEIDFEKNLIVIKPNRLATLLNSSLKNYVVYVINPKTLLPAVKMHLI